LKTAGYIKGKKFLKQPSEEVITSALTSDESDGNFLEDLFEKLVNKK